MPTPLLPPERPCVMHETGANHRDNFKGARNLRLHQAVLIQRRIAREVDVSNCSKRDSRSRGTAEFLAVVLTYEVFTGISGL